MESGNRDDAQFAAFWESLAAEARAARAAAAEPENAMTPAEFEAAWRDWENEHEQVLIALRDLRRRAARQIAVTG